MTALIERKNVEESNTWNLAPLYKELNSWKRDFKKSGESVEEILNFRGTLGESPAQLRKAFDCYFTASRELEKLYCHAHLRSDEDTGNSENFGRLQQVLGVYSKFSANASFFNPELLDIEDSRLEEFLSSPELKDYQRVIREMRRYKQHTLSPEEEQLLALGGETFQSAGKIFSQLNNADLSFGELEVDGKTQALTHANFSVFLKHEDRSIRKKAFEQYIGVFDAHRNTIAASLSSSVKKDVYLARAKRFDSALDRSLFADNVPPSVYNTLVDEASKGLAPLHRYYELRKKLLGLKESYIYDTYVPLAEGVQIETEYEEAAELVTASLAPLGEKYTSVLRGGLLEQRWVDRFENKGKRSGAYSSGCYDSLPYILMNFDSRDLRDVYTLTHEAGHSMHSFFSNENQKYQDHGYTIFVAEVASTFNEQLLTHELKKRYADDAEKMAYLINHQIDDIKSTFYRQTMFAEFERIIHDLDEAGEALTVDRFRSEYRALLEKYFGPALSFGELDDLECFRIPHFYSAFYVYKYATGLSAAIALSEAVLNGGEKELSRYLGFLKSGGSKFPLDLLRDAGVDLESAGPIQATVDKFTALVDELETVMS
ncbi:UNVERIFIED_CONTAM: hypothetical protein GTU68_066622 [Idotea baltica]|nr:hypothetical protein [Idotea baltica]